MENRSSFCLEKRTFKYKFRCEYDSISNVQNTISYKENCKLPVYQRPELKKRQPEFNNNTVRDMPASLSSLISPPLFFLKKKVRLHRCPFL